MCEQGWRHWEDVWQADNHKQTVWKQTNRLDKRLWKRDEIFKKRVYCKSNYRSVYLKNLKGCIFTESFFYHRFPWYENPSISAQHGNAVQTQRLNLIINDCKIGRYQLYLCTSGCQGLILQVQKCAWGPDVSLMCSNSTQTVSWTFRKETETERQTKWCHHISFMEKIHTDFF